MSRLDDAWEWYRRTKELLRLLDRLGDKHWDHLPWGDGPLARDDHLKTREGKDLSDGARAGLAPLDDLGVLLIFAAFESIVRDRVLSEIQAEAASLHHPALVSAASEAADRIDQGSFFRVLEPYKARDSGLVEEVKQVRKFRNWVAHGRRGGPEAEVTPRSAYERLGRFLELLDGAPEAGA